MENNYVTDVLLRELKDSIREGFERIIRRDRPDLVAALENDDDIVIGSYLKAEAFAASK